MSCYNHFLDGFHVHQQMQLYKEQRSVHKTTCMRMFVFLLSRLETVVLKNTMGHVTSFPPFFSITVLSGPLDISATL